MVRGTTQGSAEALQVLCDAVLSDAATNSPSQPESSGGGSDKEVTLFPTAAGRMREKRHHAPAHFPEVAKRSRFAAGTASAPRQLAGSRPEPGFKPTLAEQGQQGVASQEPSQFCRLPAKDGGGAAGPSAAHPERQHRTLYEPKPWGGVGGLPGTFSATTDCRPPPFSFQPGFKPNGGDGQPSGLDKPLFPDVRAAPEPEAGAGPGAGPISVAARRPLSRPRPLRRSASGQALSEERLPAEEKPFSKGPAGGALGRPLGGSKRERSPPPPAGSGERGGPFGFQPVGAHSQAMVKAEGSNAAGSSWGGRGPSSRIVPVMNDYVIPSAR